MHRLKTRPQFQAAMAGGIVSRTAHFALHRLLLEAPTASQTPTEPAAPAQGQAPKALFGVFAPHWGAVLPKRWARRAVTRNAIKRQIYALAHEWQAPHPAAFVVRLRSSFDRKQYPSAWSEPLRLAVRAELQQLWARAQKRPDGS